jgi:hypothetical protein
MYLKDFTDKVKTELGNHAITKLNWIRCGDENNDRWREVSFEEPDQINYESGLKIHYEFTKRGYDKVYFEVHCHNPNQSRWNDLCEDMMVMGEGYVEDNKRHPTRPTKSKSTEEKAGSKIISHKDSIILTEKSNIDEAVEKMTGIVKKMYDLYDPFIPGNLNSF